MSDTQYTWVICYDVSDDRQRIRLSDLLEEEGMRVQLSVFELFGSRERMRDLLAQIKEIIDPRDSVRIYALSAQTRPLCEIYGSSPPLEEGEFWIV